MSEQVSVRVFVCDLCVCMCVCVSARVESSAYLVGVRVRRVCVVALCSAHTRVVHTQHKREGATHIHTDTENTHRHRERCLVFNRS